MNAGPPDPTSCDLVCNATPMGMNEGDPLPVDAALLRSSMFVGDVIAGHGVTPFLQTAEADGCKTAGGGHMVEAALDVMADFMLREAAEILVGKVGQPRDRCVRVADSCCMTTGGASFGLGRRSRQLTGRGRVAGIGARPQPQCVPAPTDGSVRAPLRPCPRERRI